MTDVTCVLDAGAELGEGTLWDPREGVLWWVDIWGSRIHRYDPATGRDDTWETPEYVGCVGVREKGGLVLSLVSGFHLLRSRCRPFRRRSSHPAAESPDTRFNDGKPDRQGRFWSGTVFEDPAAQDRVCRRALPARPGPFVPSHGRWHRLVERPRLQPRQPHHVLRRQPGRVRLGLGLRPCHRRHRPPAHLHRLPRHGRLRRRRDRRRRGLLLDDAPSGGKGLSIRSGRPAHADDHDADATSRPAASSAAPTSTSSM